MGLRNLRSNLSMAPPEASNEAPGIGVPNFPQKIDYGDKHSTLDLNGNPGPASQQSTDNASQTHVDSLQRVPSTSPYQDLNGYIPTFTQVNDFRSNLDLDGNNDLGWEGGLMDFPSIFDNIFGIGIGNFGLFSQTNNNNWSDFPNAGMFGGSFLENLLGGFNTGDPSGMLVNILDFASGRGAGGLLNRGIEGILHGSNGLGLGNTFGIGGTTITGAVGLSTPALIPTTLNSSGQTFMDDMFGDLVGGNGGGNGATAQNPLNSSAGPSSHMINNNPTSMYAPVWGYPGEMQSAADGPYHYADNWNTGAGPNGEVGSNMLESMMFAGHGQPPFEPFGGDNHPGLAQGFRIGREVKTLQGENYLIILGVLDMKLPHLYG